MKYVPVIGLEVHLQPKTESKMFCACKADYFGSEPNTHTCPVCLGLPGALPVPNKRAIELCIKLALALNCDITKDSKFDRKNYFYPDLPKGYQISQYDRPIGTKGFVEADVKNDARRFRITRVHMEEDTGKSVHASAKTLLDFNKSGVPLIEIVTEPDFTSKEEVDAFAKRLRQIVRYCGISDADMEKGQMRYELNISVKEADAKGLPDYKIEVKNIGSISVLQKVIDFEIKRQSELLEKGEKIEQETRGIRDLSGKTYGQRKKEGAADYRYFPEPDIPVMRFDEAWIGEIRKSIPELPQEKKLRYVKEFKLDPSSAEVIVSKKTNYEYFESAAKNIKEEKNVTELAKWMLGDVKSLANKTKTSLSESKLTPELLAEFVNVVHEKNLSGKVAKDLIVRMFETGESPEKIVEKEDLSGGLNENELRSIVQKVIDSNPKIIEDIKRNPNAAKSLIGLVMRETKGKADPKLTVKLINELQP